MEQCRPYWYVLFFAQSVLRTLSIRNKAVPHRLIQDDVHEGYLIPKGSLVIPNIWSVFKL